MVNESKKQKIYDALRGQVSARLIRAMDIAEGDIGSLSLGELINTLFLMHGDGGSTGNFSVSFGAAIKMVGAELDVAGACCKQSGNHRASAAGALMSAANRSLVCWSPNKQFAHWRSHGCP